MKRLLLVLLLSTAVFAQQPAAPAPTEHPATTADVQRLFRALRLQEQMERAQQTVRATMEQMIAQVIDEQMKDLTAAQKQKFRDYMAKVAKESADVYPVSEMLGDMAPVYQKNYSKEEIDALVGFYTSPLGSRLLDKQPKVTQEAMTAITPKMQERMRKVMASAQDDARRMVEEMIKEQQATPPPKQ